MAILCLTSSLLFKPRSLTLVISSYRFFNSSNIPASHPSVSLSRLRPLSAAFSPAFNAFGSHFSVMDFSTHASSSSSNDSNPIWSNQPSKDTILLDGCDFEHWLVVMEEPEGEVPRDELIDRYIKTLAQVVGSEEEARMKIYSVSTRCYFAFGALISEELSYKLKVLPGVRWVLPDSYIDVGNKNYGGEPFVNGKAVPYDPKYHEEWVKNNARANERNRRNDRPRSHDRSRNFERRGPYNNTGGKPPPNNAPQSNMRGMLPQNNTRGEPPYVGNTPNLQNNRD